jgi:HAD superfamily hydrolase (TIGR01509 family)
MPDAILFDLDGTLVDSEAENGEAAVEAVGGLGGRLDEGQAAALRQHVIGRTWEDAARFVLEHGWLPRPTEVAVVENAMLEAKLARCRAHGWRVLPGAVQAILWAAARGPFAVVSGSKRPEIAAALAEGLGLDGVVPAASIVAAEDYPRGKPAPDPYLEGARRVERPPARCLAVEDSRAGIASAQAAGLRVIAVRAGNFAGQDQSAADVVIDTLDDLARAVADLENR